MMKFRIALIVFAATLMAAQPASAFSSEKAGNVIPGDASNFTDPDDKVLSPSNQSSIQPSQVSPSVTPDQNAAR
jgi:hypothetical protein